MDEGHGGSQEQEHERERTSDDSIEDLSVSEKDQKPQNRNRSVRIAIVMIAVFGVVAFVLGYVILQNHLARLSEDSTARDPSRYLEQHPDLVFRNVVFQKYLVWGRPAGATPQFETLLVYHVEGTASLILPLHSLTIVEEETDYILRRIAVSVPRDTMIDVQVNIPPNSVVEVERIDAVPMPTETIEAISTVAGTAGGVVAGWVGLQAGGVVGGAVGGAVPITGGGVVGRLAGNILGGAAGGATGYLATRNFAHRMLENIDFGAGSISERDMIIDRAKPLIGLEILTGVSGPPQQESTEHELIQKYEEEVREQLETLFRAFGWNEVTVHFDRGEEA